MYARKMMMELMRYVRPTPQLPPPRNKLSMSKERLRRIGAALVGFLLMLTLFKASRYTRKYHIHILAPEKNSLQFSLPADVRHVVARAAALARAELEQTGLDEEPAVAKSAKDTASSDGTDEDKDASDEQRPKQFRVERHLIDASHVGDEESVSPNGNDNDNDNRNVKAANHHKNNIGTEEQQELTEAVTVKAKAEEDDNSDAEKDAGDSNGNHGDEGEEGGGEEENGISSSAKMAGEREKENHDDAEGSASVGSSTKSNSNDKEEEGTTDEENEENSGDGNDGGDKSVESKDTNISNEIHGDSVAKDGEGEVVAAKEAGTNYNTDANRKKNGGSEESEADYFGGLRTAGGQRRADTGGPDERLSTRDFGAIFGLAIAHSAVISRSDRAHLSKHEITLDEKYERLRLTGELVELIEKYADALENAAAGGEESLVYVRKASAGYGLFAARSLPTGSVLGEYGGRYTRITSSNIRDASEEYTWKLPPLNVNGSIEDGWGIDASEWGNALRFANDLGPGSWNINVKYVPWNGHWHVIYETKTPVLEGEELSVSYGAKYWSRRSSATNLGSIPEY